ncbi:hypothetical protein [Secundilactobacillus silagei]|uniref:Uncharacterized protein n=1 Tax=Secundilactobacillus silagei JCM 19001 TaxID=1302250 RepID=A0A1Z5IHW5_9LACO|nr:hypothetical protein [Secundilactobacillus silagei]TDG67421.1 hypothetical protein C5L25_001017 [Secundilactobacillus silagei JCM 19001]GAX01364.1 hypothetical protein IWT126_01391 [Secundilactobacillus silagei JCM 19001]
MLKIDDSIARLAWNTEHHFLHIQAQHDFMRAWAIQFELGYTDLRMIQFALQLAEPSQSELLTQLTTAYQQVYQYEYAFVAGGLEGFNQQFGNQMADYEKAEKQLLQVLDQIKALSD